ncbi:interferon-induced very large GTPase 1-like [Heteronotia binoei]|uniref:interferon-induced very large GTPase 1-like n=1 Tax=Heteronotia binoei TaxID=13085 RepID=UPI002931BEB4|nr:interferon-induced very large GTPase 1-like [Heteronotia binoei]
MWERGGRTGQAPEASANFLSISLNSVILALCSLQPYGKEATKSFLTWSKKVSSFLLGAKAPSTMASTEKPSDIIQEARRKLTEALLQIEPDLILDVVDSHRLLSQSEYFSLSSMKDPHRLLQNLIDTVLRKGETAHELFLDCLQNLRHVFPSLCPLSEYLENGPVDLKHETEIPNTAGLLISQTEKLGVAVSPVEGNEAESLDSSVSSAAGKEKVEKTGAVLVPSGTGSEAENPDIVLSSTQGKEGKNQDATEGGDGTEKPGVSTVCPERATKQFSLSTKENSARLLCTTNTPGSTPAEESPCSAEQNLKGAISPGPSPQGSVDTSMIPASETIRKGRKQLIEILEKDLDLVLDELFSECVITEEENEALNKIEEDSKKSRKLLLLIQKKGEMACSRFLEHLEITCPGSNQVLQRCSSPEQKVEVQQELEQVEKHPTKGCSSPEQKGEVQQELEQEEKHPAKERRKALKDILRKLKLQKKKSKKFSLQEILEISSGSLKECIPSSMGDLPWHFLRKVLALNVTARSTSLEKEAFDPQRTREEEKGNRIDESAFCTVRMGERDSVNPLDVLCAVLLCSDSFLQQEILSKMSMCQFALPLLLPPLEVSHCTLMLWAMREIVKKWRPHSLVDSRGFREESLVLMSMPTFSFVRMGSLSLSKSKLLNEFLSPSQQHHDFFLHRDMECGNIPREMADGLVEIAWYFPGGQKSLDLFPEPIAVANLHGDVESHWVQFSFLSEISSAIFIFAEHIGEREYALLSSLKESSTKYYFILEYHGGKINETLKVLNKLAPVLNLSNSHILAKDGTTNTAEFVEQLRLITRRIINSPLKTVSIQEMATVAHELTIQVDEDLKECQDARSSAVEITRDVIDTAVYKKEMLKLQGDLWKNLAKVEKELCRMERQGETPSEKYRSEQRDKLMALREQQNKCELSIGLINFIHGIKCTQSAEKHYFLKWMKFNLDQIARANLSKLRAEYKEKCKSLGGEVQKIAEVDQLISSSSLGVEHFMRELGQFYEAEWLMVKERKLPKNGRQFTHFPSIAADLMLEGFPLELIDGDASNIPLQWITDVLTKLNNKLRRRSKMFVITVLGVQSTGKSTLLNTMFGLQFAVSSGRCTRGAFMTLLKVRENLIQELGCDFILVIDTEGLKAPELAKLEDSYQHDNELATLVIGLSDVTIVNMSMENATEMKDILQIVAHAFLRMEKIGQRPNCQFVHQNVSDVSAHDQNMRDRKHLLEQLNEMTQAAAKMEKIDRDIKFSDIMDYDPEIHNWYIPGLWHGVPPMASVNRGYSEKVFEIKKYLFDFLRERSVKKSPKDIPQFIEWIKSLWNAVKHENFIFSFRNSLIAEAYNHLSAKYSEWDWSFRREMHLWVSEQETLIQNASPDELDCLHWRHELQQKLLCGEQQILENLNKYFESGASNLHLVEKYREDFVRSANSLKHELDNYSFNKCNDAIHIKEGRYKIDTLQMEYLKVIEGKVDKLLDECRKEERRLDDQELKTEFERMWTETLSEISPIHLENRQIYLDIEWCLRKELSHRGSSVNLKVQEAKSLLNYRMNTFQMKSEYINSSIWHKVKCIFSKKEHLRRAEEIVNSLLSKCILFIDEKVNSRGDYDETYCVELLHIINHTLQQSDVQKLNTSLSFEVDLKLHILGEAAHIFQKKHEDFIKENDPQVRLEKLKPQYFSIFRNHYLERDAQQNRAKDFCDLCLHPALEDYVNKRLGIEIVDDILNSTQSIGYASRSFFQFTILKELLEDRNASNYVQYNKSYEKFVKSWIMRQILEHYADKHYLKNLEKNILFSIVKKIRKILENLKHKRFQEISEFLEFFCKEMQKELVISKDSLVGIQFKNMSDPGQFSVCVENFLPDLEIQILSEFDALDLESKLSKLPVKPQDEIFKRVFGCGKQCPFCKVPCEAGGSDHKEHFAAIHRPVGLGTFRWEKTEKLVYELCSTLVVSQCRFRTAETEWDYHPYKDYRVYYPDWCIQPDPSINASDYWKFVFKEFNHEFACHYEAKPADLPEDWKTITQEQALEALKETYNME